MQNPLEVIEILKQAIEEIDSEIGVRKELSKIFHQGLKDSRDWLNTCLKQFETWQFVYKPSVDFRRTSLERELLAVHKELRAEQQRAFSDIVVLQKERRNLLTSFHICR